MIQKLQYDHRINLRQLKNEQKAYSLIKPFNNKLTCQVTTSIGFNLIEVNQIMLSTFYLINLIKVYN